MGTASAVWRCRVIREMSLPFAIPGTYYSKGEQQYGAESLAPTWGSKGADLKRRHFVLDGERSKLFGRRGKTYKGCIPLLAVEALRPTTDQTAPTGALEL